MGIEGENSRLLSITPITLGRDRFLLHLGCGLPLFLSLLLLSCTAPESPAPHSEELDIYFVDVEGGQATLIVTPEGESMLVDSGSPGFEGRDIGRILQAAQLAGLKQLDYMLVTHYHLDHAGAVPELAERIPIVTFVDHGPNQEETESAAELYENYRQVRARARHLLVAPGDEIPLKGAEVTVVSAAGKALSSPLEGAGGENPLCPSAERKEDDSSENAQSVGFVLEFGRFRFIDLGDLTWNKELELACPSNLIGDVDVYLTTHHGLPSSGPRALVHALRPRVAVMNNGATKGGHPDSWQVVRDSPRLQDLWQLHYSVAASQAANSPPEYLANLEDDHKGSWIKLSARRDGSFTVTNSRNGFQKEYPAKKLASDLVPRPNPDG